MFIQRVRKNRSARDRLLTNEVTTFKAGHRGAIALAVTTPWSTGGGVIHVSSLVNAHTESA
jgi:hypothetical protein